MSSGNQFTYLNVLIFFILWVFFTSITSGTAIPLGIFIPCIMIGCGLGVLYYPMHTWIFGTGQFVIKQEVLSILGASAVLSGATRMTYSLAVVMLETTSNVELFLPIIFTLFTSYGVGALCIAKSIYGGGLRAKNIPVLNKRIPKINRHLVANNFMSAPPISFSFLETVEKVYYQL